MEIILKDPYDDQRGDDPISILRSLKEKNADRPVICSFEYQFYSSKIQGF